MGESCRRDGGERLGSATLAAFSLSVIIPSSTQTLLIPALPTLTEERGYSAVVNAWLLSAFLIGASLSAPLVGRVGDLRGRRVLTVVTSSAYVVGSIICLVGGEHGELVAMGRAFQGISAGVFALHISTIQELVPSPTMRATHIGLLSGVVAIGPAVGFLLGGLVTAHLGVTTIFVVGAVVGSVSTALLWFLTPASGGRSRGTVDGPGAVLMALSLFCVLGWLTEVGVSGLSGTRANGALVVSMALLVVTAWWLRRLEEPFIDLAILSERVGAWGNLATVLSAVSMFGLFVAVPQLVQDDGASGFGLGPIAAGLFLVPGAVAMVLVAPAAAKVGAARGHGRVILVGNTVCALSMFALAVLPPSVAAVAALATTAGLGIGIAFPALPSAVMEAAPHGSVGVAAGINSLSRGIGSAVGAQVVLMVSTASVMGGANHRVAFAVSAGGAALAALVAIQVSSRPPRA